MSNVAKFLIVLNLILAGVFVGSAANYLGQKDYVQTDLQKEVEALKSSVKALTKTNAEIDGLNKQLNVDKNTLTTERDTAVTKAGTLEGENANLHKLLTSQGEQLTNASQGLNSLNATLSALQALNGQLTEKATTSSQRADKEYEARMNAEAAQARLQQQLNAETSAKQLAMAAVAEANQTKSTLTAEVEFWRRKFPNVDSGPAQPVIPPAKVLAADNQLDIVIISVGGDSGVAIGFDYTISRGSKFVAKIKITDVQADKATGMIVKGMKATNVTPGDTVTNG